MVASEIIKSIMKEQQVNKSYIAKKLALPFQTIYDRLTQTNISIDKLQEMLSVLGYQIVITPKYCVLPMRCYVVESSKKQSKSNTNEKVKD